MPNFRFINVLVSITMGLLLFITSCSDNTQQITQNDIEDIADSVADSLGISDSLKDSLQNIIEDSIKNLTSISSLNEITGTWQFSTEIQYRKLSISLVKLPDELIGDTTFIQEVNIDHSQDSILSFIYVEKISENQAVGINIFKIGNQYYVETEDGYDTLTLINNEIFVATAEGDTIRLYKDANGNLVFLGHFDEGDVMSNEEAPDTIKCNDTTNIIINGSFSVDILGGLVSVDIAVDINSLPKIPEDSIYEENGEDDNNIFFQAQQWVKDKVKEVCPIPIGPMPSEDQDSNFYNDTVYYSPIDTNINPDDTSYEEPYPTNCPTGYGYDETWFENDPIRDSIYAAILKGSEFKVFGIVSIKIDSSGDTISVDSINSYLEMVYKFSPNLDTIKFYQYDPAGVPIDSAIALTNVIPEKQAIFMTVMTTMTIDYSSPEDPNSACPVISPIPETIKFLEYSPDGNRVKITFIIEKEDGSKEIIEDYWEKIIE